MQNILNFGFSLWVQKYREKGRENSWHNSVLAQTGRQVPLSLQSLFADLWLELFCTMQNLQYLIQVAYGGWLTNLWIYMFLYRHIL